MPDSSPVLLLVTWLVAGQPPASYQVEFTSADKCERAKGQLYTPRNALDQDYKNEPTARLTPGVAAAKQPAPNLMAACAPKQGKIEIETPPKVLSLRAAVAAWQPRGGTRRPCNPLCRAEASSR